MGRHKKYKTEEERKAAQREYQKKYYQNNKEKFAGYFSKWRKNNKEKFSAYQVKYHAEYRQNNREKIAEYQAEYYATPKGRASTLLKAYKFSDKMYNRGECTLTPDWIVEHIFNQPCHYCGKTDWTKIGCDRIDNSLPHRPDNVVPCCCECNIKKARYSYDEYMKMIGKIA